MYFLWQKRWEGDRGRQERNKCVGANEKREWAKIEVKERPSQKHAHKHWQKRKTEIVLNEVEVLGGTFICIEMGIFSLWCTELKERNKNRDREYGMAIVTLYTISERCSIENFKLSRESHWFGKDWDRETEIELKRERENCYVFVCWSLVLVWTSYHVWYKHTVSVIWCCTHAQSDYERTHTQYSLSISLSLVVLMHRTSQSLNSRMSVGKSMPLSVHSPSQVHPNV